MENLHLLEEALRSLFERKDGEQFKAHSIMLKKKVLKGDIYKGITEEQYNAVEAKVLGESVLDPVQKSRSENIFDANEVMLPEVKKFILDTFNNWKAELDTKFDIVSVYLIGSSSGFQYTATSDIDVNIKTTLTDEESRVVRRMIPNSNLLPGTAHPVNYFMMSKDEVYNEDHAENIYDILNDTWIKKSDKSDIEIPLVYVLEVSKFFMNAFDLSISEYERDKQDFLTYRELDPTKVEISEKEKTEVMTAKLNEIRTDVDTLRMGQHILKAFLTEGYEDSPFKINIQYTSDDPRYSMNNLIFKTIEKYGYRDKVFNLIKEGRELIQQYEAELEKQVEETTVTESRKFKIRLDR
jgi:hypothetical protein